MSIMIKIFWIQFINIGVVLLLVNINAHLSIPYFPILDGTYTEFNVRFYKIIGSTLILTMLLNIVSPHAANMFYICLKGCSKCRDRGCSCDKKKTKQITQKKYEKMNIGPIFDLDRRYSAILNVIYITLMFSTGLPFLYIIAFISFFLMYWVDKILLLRCYKNPPSYS